MATFIVDCPRCRAKVAAVEAGRAQRNYTDEDNAPYSERLSVGQCPVCTVLLAGFSTQTHFADIDAEYDVWSDPVRVYPNPAKTFSSFKDSQSGDRFLNRSHWLPARKCRNSSLRDVRSRTRRRMSRCSTHSKEKKDAKRNRRMMLRNSFSNYETKGSSTTVFLIGANNSTPFAILQHTQKGTATSRSQERMRKTFRHLFMPLLSMCTISRNASRNLKERQQQRERRRKIPFEALSPCTSHTVFETLPLSGEPPTSYAHLVARNAFINSR